MTRTRKSSQTIAVYKAEDLTVVNGANLGDPISFADELALDDMYELVKGARKLPLTIMANAGANFAIAPGSALGEPGADLYFDACLTLMSTNGQTTEMLTLVEVDATDMVAAVYVMPLVTMKPRLAYSLVGIDRDSAQQRYAEMACVSFTRGTRIATASGAQKPVEELQIGDRVLTRDDGAQEVRWIGRSTTRAVGEFCPILIRAGALNNANDLLVSPDHRLFIYQRSDTLGAGRAEVLVRARHLVNGHSITRQEGGFVEYVQLLFDAHQIVYAEGIAAETLLVDTRTCAALPDGLAERLMNAPEAHAGRAHLDFEIDETLVRDLDAAALLRRASLR